ncbi:MAG: hypothetical protein ACTSQK_02440 [Candidatus Heimdallarchaeota archaeon]
MTRENDQQDTEPVDKVTASTISSNSTQKQEIRNTGSFFEQSTPSKKEQLKTNFKIAVGMVKLFFSWKVISMSLAHHPECETFEDHVFKIGKLRLCRGCTLSYPPMYALVLMFIFWPDAMLFLTSTGLWIPNLWWFTIGFGVTGASALLLRKYSLFINDIYKFCRGAFAGFLVTIILSQHWGFKIGAVVILMGAMGLLSIHRGKEMEKICEECEWNANFDECPGWTDITQSFNEVLSTHQTSTTQKSNTILVNDQQASDEKVAESNQLEVTK